MEDDGGHGFGQYFDAVLQVREGARIAELHDNVKLSLVQRGVDQAHEVVVVAEAHHPQFVLYPKKEKGKTRRRVSAGDRKIET